MERRVDPKRSAAIDRIVGQKVAPAAPGLALAVIKNGETVHLAGYGLASLTTGTPITPGTQFHMASCGKQFTGLGIMMLKEAGALGYDDYIGRHIPELAACREGVTIRRLLHHVSGVYNFYNKPLERKLLALSPHPSNAHLVRLYATLGCSMSTTVGRFSYNNAGYDLLGCVIERVSGQSYGEFFRSRVFAPLGMAHTFSQPAEARLAGRRCATGYEKKNGRHIAQSEHRLDGICGSGSIYSTAADLCRYDAALATNRLVSAATMRTALTSGVRHNGTPIHYGFGWELDMTSGARFAEHGGEWNGFVSLLRRYRDRRLSIYVLANTTGIEPEKIAKAAAKQFWD
jgi:CubicO group peptidase (beta-lactamase class C family)